MSESESKLGTAVGSDFEEEREEERGRGSGGPPTPPTKPTTAGHGPFHILKPGQGKYVRAGTAAGVGLLAIAGALFLSDQMQVFNVVAENQILRLMIPVAFLVVIAYLVFLVVGRKESVVDFMIATEGEMKKVNWSTRREVWGATRVVIVTVFALGLLLFIVDAVFMVLFGKIGVLQNVRLLDILFGGGAGEA